jgi:hypothetical protein
MHYNYQGLQDWAIAQYSLLDTKRALEARLREQRVPNEPITPETLQMLPRGLLESHHHVKDVLASERCDSASPFSRYVLKGSIIGVAGSRAGPCHLRCC